MARLAPSGFFATPAQASLCAPQVVRGDGKTRRLAIPPPLTAWSEQRNKLYWLKGQQDRSEPP